MAKIIKHRSKDNLNFEIVNGQRVDALSGTTTQPPSNMGASKPELVTIDFKFIRQQQGKPNAEGKIVDYHGQRWDVKNGGKLQSAQLEADHASKTASEAEAEHKKAKVKLDKIERYETGGETNDEDGNPVKSKSTPYSQWPRYDLIKMCVLVVTCFALLGLGAVNVAVLILGSDIPAFLENPALAYLLGALVPAIAMAVKSAEQLCGLDRHKHYFAVAIYVLAGIVSFAWVVFFTITFEGNTADIWSDIGEGVSDHTIYHTLRNITQILAEVLIGAAIFLVIDRMHSKHSSQSISEKTGWRELSNSVDKLRDARDSARETSNAAAAIYKQLQAARNAFTLEAIGHLSD